MVYFFSGFDSSVFEEKGAYSIIGAASSLTTDASSIMGVASTIGVCFLSTFGVGASLAMGSGEASS